MTKISEPSQASISFGGPRAGHKTKQSIFESLAGFTGGETGRNSDESFPAACKCGGGTDGCGDCAVGGRRLPTLQPPWAPCRFAVLPALFSSVSAFRIWRWRHVSICVSRQWQATMSGHATLMVNSGSHRHFFSPHRARARGVERLSLACA